MEKQEPCRIVGESMYFELKENKPHGTKDDPFSIYHIENAGRSFQIPVHWHDEFEIIYVKSGVLNVNISGENYTGSTGEVFVVSPGNLHFMGSQTGKVDYYTLLFPLEYVSFQSNDLLEKEVMAPLKSGKRMIKPQLGAGLSDICDNLIALEHSDLTLSATQKEQEIAENTSDNRNNLIIQFEIKSRLLLFFKRVLQSGFILENNISGRNTTEKEMISYIQQNFTRKISLKEFGNQFHLSEKYISRYFKEHFHITISQYINHLRMEHARQLLQETTLPVTEVAMRCGYENVSYFIRSFKKMYGNPPLKYRNEI